MNQKIFIILGFFILFGGVIPFGLKAEDQGNFPEIKTFTLTPQPVAPGENVDFSLEFTSRVIKTTVILGDQANEQISLVSDSSGLIWTGRHQLSSNIKPGQYKIKIYWLPPETRKNLLPYKIYGLEVAARTGPGIDYQEESQEEKIDGFIIKIDSAQTSPEDVSRLINYYEKNLQYSPGNPQTRRKLAGLYLKNREPARAIGALEKATEIQPAPYDFLELNRLYTRLKETKRGEDFFKKLAINQPAAVSGLGLLQTSLRNFLTARDTFKKALKTNPSDMLALLGSARAYWELGWWADAEKALKEAEKQNPDHPGLTYFYGLFWQARRDYRQAGEYLNQALKNGFPPGVLIYSALAQVSDKQNQPEKATDFYRKILVFEPDNPEAIARNGSIIQTK